MTRSPSTTTIARHLQDIVKRMGTVEVMLKEHDTDIEELKGWKRETEYAKKILKEYQDAHPEVRDNKNYGKALAALTAAVVALTAIILALK